MATVVLGSVGAALTGTVGGILATGIGRAVDNRLIASLSPARQTGRRLDSLALSSSAEGTPRSVVFGRARVAGQIIWAARFLEKRKASSGGKGGQKTVEYEYSLSLAVAVGEGVIDGIGRIWADGQVLNTSAINYRVHCGSEDQQPDSLIEAVEGVAPAYRGTAYVVFEDLGLGVFGNRVPQLAFEVFKRVPDALALENLLEGVCLIPGAGEFCLASEAVLRRDGLSRAVAENVNQMEGVSDLKVSLDQLMMQVPNLKRVSLVVGWFGTSVEAGECEVKPGVEHRLKVTSPFLWEVAGETRNTAYQISRIEDAKGASVPAYGGTPSDESVRQAIRDLKARGLEVTLYPFVFMDCEGYPWRGRITAADEAGVDHLFGDADGWGLRRQALHYAQLVADEGADGLLIGSEMRGLTWSRGANGGFPAVDQFIALAEECRAIVGSGVKLSYAADWSEYFGKQANGEVWYHLDPLWADENIDYVGIDWYAPMGDWRAGDWRYGGGGLDGEAGYRGPTDRAYLAAQVAGGEGYDWYYASGVDRDLQVRTPIEDGLAGEDWVYRYKDLKNWWSHRHYNRPDGVRATVPTDWVPQMKPIRLTEFGCAAVDRGCNAPNLFQDPKSTENSLPPYSTGARDDRVQRRMMEAMLRHYREPQHNPVSGVYGGVMLDGMDAWCWDARPFPAFPSRGDLWADCDAWREGHWLNGRMVGDGERLIEAVLEYGGLSADDYEVGELDGRVPGYVIERPMRLREALEPLVVAFGARVAERGGRVTVRDDGAAAVKLEMDRLVLPDKGAGLVAERRLGLRPEAVRVRFADEAADYQTGAVVYRNPRGGQAGGVGVGLPILCDAETAGRVAMRVLAEESGEAEGLSVFLGPLEALGLEPGDVVEVEGFAGEWRVGQLNWDEEPSAKLEPVVRLATVPTSTDWHPVEPPVTLVTPYVQMVEMGLDEAGEAGWPLAVVAADPWVPMAVYGGVDVDDLSRRATVEQPATVGQLLGSLEAGVFGRWDWANEMMVTVEGLAPQSRSAVSVLSGRNRVLVEGRAGWELVQFRQAEMVMAGVWKLKGLLRGCTGTQGEALAGAVAGATVVLVDEALVPVEMRTGERGLGRLWRVGPVGLPAGGEMFSALNHVWMGRGLRPWQPGHLRWTVEGEDWRFAWVPCVRGAVDAWEGEATEADSLRFRLRVLAQGVEVRRWEVLGGSTVYGVDERLADLEAGDEIAVCQWGEDWGWGAEARLKLA